MGTQNGFHNFAHRYRFGEQSDTRDGQEISLRIQAVIKLLGKSLHGNLVQTRGDNGKPVSLHRLFKRVRIHEVIMPANNPRTKCNTTAIRPSCGPSVPKVLTSGFAGKTQQNGYSVAFWERAGCWEDWWAKGQRILLPMMIHHMTQRDWWDAGKFLLAALVVFFIRVSLITPQKELWKKPSKKLLITFCIVWGITIAFVLFLYLGPH